MGRTHKELWLSDQVKEAPYTTDLKLAVEKGRVLKPSGSNVHSLDSFSREAAVVDGIGRITAGAAGHPTGPI